MGKETSEKFETLCYFENLALINYRYTSSGENGLTISAIRKDKNIVLNAVQMGKLQSPNTFPADSQAIPSSLLYIKLSRLIGTSIKSLEYISINEDKRIK